MMELPKKILIADDEPGAVMVLGMRLRANGYKVIAAHDGAQAIDLVRQEEPDLIVLDIKIPGKNGYTVFEELKASANTMSIPVIFFSALPPEQAQEKAIQLSAVNR
jgi:CheY-like chemotaxis protein